MSSDRTAKKWTRVLLRRLSIPVRVDSRICKIQAAWPFLLDQDLGQPKVEELAGCGRACLLVQLDVCFAGPTFSLLELRRARSSHSQLCGRRPWAETKTVRCTPHTQVSLSLTRSVVGRGIPKSSSKPD